MLALRLALIAAVAAMVASECSSSSQECSLQWPVDGSSMTGRVDLDKALLRGATSDRSGISLKPVPDPDLDVPPYKSPYTSPDIPLDYGKQPMGASEPEQISLFPASDDGSLFSLRFILPHSSSPSSHHSLSALFSRSHDTAVRPLLPESHAHSGGLEQHYVRYGTSLDDMQNSAWAVSSRYTFGNGTEGAYESGDIFFARLGPLEPNTRYFYRIDVPSHSHSLLHSHSLSHSRVFNFTSFPAAGSSASYPLKIALLGDVGQTFNSSSTYSAVLAADPRLVLFAGDLSYADHYGPPCVSAASTAAAAGHAGGGLTRGSPSQAHSAAASGSQEGVKVCGIGGLRWDSWGRLTQPLFSHIPVAFTPGNHELEFVPEWNEMQPFKAYTARVPAMQPYSAKKQRYAPHKAPVFYSFDFGPVHVISISSYSAFIKYSHQYYWLREDLCTVNRKKTPWVIVFMHVPLYSTNREHYVEGEPMRDAYEQWLHEAGVDLVAAGHVHAYERSRPVFSLKPADDGCAAVYVTVGDGGNIEEVAGPFLEPQPVYSAYRETSFGHAELQLLNSSAAVYTWYRNQDGEAVQADSFMLRNRAHHCGPPRPSFCKRYKNVPMDDEEV